MASNKMDKGKCHGAGEVKAALRHNDTSPERRAVAAHGNKHIDAAKSHLNVNLTGDTYAERCAKYDARIAELDAQPGANKRKDRVTGQLIETPVPAGLPREKYNEFLRRVLELQVEMYGAENLISADIHWDEEHEYLDAETGEKRMSRVHLQSVFVPVKDGKLYGQAIFNRAGLRKLNTACQRMAVKEFGCNFMDGTGRMSKKSVAELKAESAALSVKKHAVDDAVKTRQEAQSRLSAVEAREKAAMEEERRIAELRAATEADRAEAARLLRQAKVGYSAGFSEWCAGKAFKNGKTAEDYLDQWEREYKADLNARLGEPKPKPGKRSGKVKPEAQKPPEPAQQPVPAPAPEPQRDTLEDLREQIRDFDWSL